jgi:two-component system invasion response regulator UvrY
MIRVLIADNQALMRRGLSAILSLSQELSSVEEAACLNQALFAFKERQIDVCLLDMKLDDYNTIELIKSLKRAAAKTKFVILCRENEALPLNLMMNLGITVFLSRGCELTEVYLAVMSAHRCNQYISPQLAQQELFRNKGSSETLLTQLSPRELQILNEIIAGKSIQTISKELFLSPKTISTYRSRLFQKLDLEHDVQLIHFALEHGLLKQPSVSVLADEPAF